MFSSSSFSPVSFSPVSFAGLKSSRVRDFLSSGVIIDDHLRNIGSVQAIASSRGIARAHALASIRCLAESSSVGTAWARLGVGPIRPAQATAAHSSQARMGMLVRCALARGETSPSCGHAVMTSWGDPEEALILALFAKANAARNKSSRKVPA